ncbi:MAG: hypothetical protein U9N49_10120 [Campylobacterota bacterium]|nr:hypothetical protein [Campylobacterota bacterium]
MDKFDKVLQSIRELRDVQAQTDEQMQKTFHELAESDKKTDAKLDRVAKMVGNISNNQGDIAEEFFYNSLEAKPTLGGIEYDYIDKNITRSNKSLRDEFDIVLINGKDIAIIETKYKAHQKDVEKLINKKYKNFQTLYPEYKDYNHHLGIASFYINDDTKEMALDNNVMVLQRKGDVIETIVP